MATTVGRLFGEKTVSRVNPSNGRIVTTHERNYRLSVDSEMDSEQARLEFISEEGITLYQPHETDIIALCMEITATQEVGRAPWRFLVGVKWSTEAPDSKERENDDPFEDEVEIESDDEIVTLPLFKDRDDVMIANTVGDPIGGLEQEEYIETVRITRNEPRRDGDRDRLFRGKVNRNTFSGGEPGTVRIRSIKCSRKFRKGIEYWRYVYELAYNARGWQPRLLNEGLYKLDDSVTPSLRVEATDSNNVPVTSPVPLDEDGKQIAAENLPDDAHYLDFNTIEDADFDILGLPV